MEIKLDELIPVFDFDTTTDEPIIETTSEEPEDIKKVDDTIEEKEETPEVSPAATLFYKELAANGIGKDEKEEYSFEDINQLISEYTEKLPGQIAQEIIESTPDLGKKAIDYIFTKGAALTKDDLKEFMATYLDDISGNDISIDSDDKAREFLAGVYKKQGLRDNVIEVMLDTYEDDGLLQEEAKKHIESKESKADQLLNNAKQTNEEIRQAQLQFVNSINAELDSLKWNKTKVNQVKQDLFSGKTSEILQKASKSAKALVQLGDFASYWDEKTESFDFAKFIEKLNSKETKSLKDKITEDMFNSIPPTRSRAASTQSKFDGLVPIVGV